MNTKNRLSLIVAAILALGPYAAVAQGEQQERMYVAVECMKSNSLDYLSVESDVWQPMHQELVNRGQRNSWSLYRVLYGDKSKCDFYTVTTYLGDDQLNDDPALDKVFDSVHPGKNFVKAMVRTSQSRSLVASELWIVVDSTEVGQHRFAVVNKMHASDPDAYERMEIQVFKPGHEALVEKEHRAGWAMYALVSPVGSSIPYNYGTVDFSNKLSPVPMAEAMLSAHPDRDLAALQNLLKLRDQVSSETWALVAATQAPSEGK